MKKLAMLSILLAGCSNHELTQAQLQDMRTDIALRHRLEKYACPSCLDGFSKENTVAIRRPESSKRSQPTLVVKQKSSPPPSYPNPEIQELSARVGALEDAAAQNAAATNKVIEGSNVMVDQITKLKSEIGPKQ